MLIETRSKRKVTDGSRERREWSIEGVAKGQMSEGGGEGVETLKVVVEHKVGEAGREEEEMVAEASICDDVGSFWWKRGDGRHI